MRRPPLKSRVGAVAQWFPAFAGKASRDRGVENYAIGAIDLMSSGALCRTKMA